MSNELPNEHAAPQPADDSPESLLHAAEGMVRSGRHREAAPIYADCIRTYPDCAAGYIGRGRCVAAMDKHADAIEDFEAALAIEPDYAAALYHRAISRLALGRSGSGSNHEAMDDLNRAIELKPDYAETYSARSGERVRTGANH